MAVEDAGRMPAAEDAGRVAEETAAEDAGRTAAVKVRIPALLNVPRTSDHSGQGGG